MSEARHIQPQMVAFIDEKLKGNGAAQEALKAKDARAVFVYAMEACVGIREVGGNNSGPMVELIQKTIGNACREAWCMAAQQTGIAYAEVKCGIKSDFPATEHCLTAWRTSPPDKIIKVNPRRGDVAIWQHGMSDSGHTGCLLETLTPYYVMAEGNTEAGLDPKGRVERDGGGFYRTQRFMFSKGDMNLLGFIRPF